MQCQFGIFLEDSLTFLLGDLKKRKIYNIFRLFLVFFFSGQPTNRPHGMIHQDGECPWSPLSPEMSREMGGGGAFFFFF